MGTNLSNEYVAPINNIFDSLWSSISIKLNGCEITDPSSKWYAYKAYFENHISYSSSCKENVLSYRGYYRDSAGKFDEVGNLIAQTPSTNAGFLKRKELFASSQWVYFAINLHSDITTLRKYIPPGIQIELEFQRNVNKFCLLSDIHEDNYAIEIDDLRLKVDRIIPSEKIEDFYKKNIENKVSPRLPIDRSLLKIYIVNQGLFDLSEYNIISGNQLPDQVIVGIVDHDANMGYGISDIGYGIWDMGYGISDMGYRIWDMGYRIWDMEYGIWDMGYGISDMGYGIWDMGYRIWDMGYRIWDMGPC